MGGQPLATSDVDPSSVVEQYGSDIAVIVRSSHHECGHPVQGATVGVRTGGETTTDLCGFPLVAGVEQFANELGIR